MGSDGDQPPKTAGAASLLAVIFGRLMLASQFGKLLQPLTLMFSVPLALMGVLLGLLARSSTLDMTS